MLLVFGKHFYQLWQFFYSTGEIFIDVSGQILSKLSSHLVTLRPPPKPRRPQNSIFIVVSNGSCEQSNTIGNRYGIGFGAKRHFRFASLFVLRHHQRGENARRRGRVRRCSFPERRSRWAKNKLKLQKAENKSSSSELSRTILQVKNAVITEFIWKRD